MSLIDFIGDQIKTYRIAHNMTQEDLAEKSGISQSHISYYERGAADSERNDIRISTLERIADALDIKVTDLLVEVTDEKNDCKIDKSEAANRIIKQKKRECFYPPNFIDNQISSLVEFVLYLPLIKQRDLIEIVYRVGGDIIGNEIYLASIISRMVNKIPDSPQKAYADWTIRQIKKIRGKREYESGEVPMELFNAYKNEVEKKYKFYLTIDTLKHEFIMNEKEEICDLLSFFDKSNTPPT